MSELRERLARLLYARSEAAAECGTWDEIGKSYQDCFRRDADAVIAELGLTCEENNILTGHEWYRCRYVADWTADMIYQEITDNE